MLDIETTHKLASFLEAKFSLKNTTEIPSPVHGPLQHVYVFIYLIQVRSCERI